MPAIHTHTHIANERALARAKVIYRAGGRDYAREYGSRRPFGPTRARCNERRARANERRAQRRRWRLTTTTTTREKLCEPPVNQAHTRLCGSLLTLLLAQLYATLVAPNSDAVVLVSGRAKSEMQTTVNKRARNCRLSAAGRRGAHCAFCIGCKAAKRTNNRPTQITLSLARARAAIKHTHTCNGLAFRRNNALPLSSGAHAMRYGFTSLGVCSYYPTSVCSRTCTHAKGNHRTQQVRDYKHARNGQSHDIEHTSPIERAALGHEAPCALRTNAAGQLATGVWPRRLYSLRVRAPVRTIHTHTDSEFCCACDVANAIPIHRFTSWPERARAHALPSFVVSCRDLQASFKSFEIARNSLRFIEFHSVSLGVVSFRLNSRNHIIFARV